MIKDKRSLVVQEAKQSIALKSCILSFFVIVFFFDTATDHTGCLSESCYGTFFPLGDYCVVLLFWHSKFVTLKEMFEVK